MQVLRHKAGIYAIRLHGERLNQADRTLHLTAQRLPDPLIPFEVLAGRAGGKVLGR